MSEKTLVVHDGTFHADEVFCLAVLLELPEFRECRVVRTRDKELIDSAYAAVDVGGEYDHARRRYDHHQRGYNEVFNEGSRVKMAAAGLIWRHFGLEYLSQRYPTCTQLDFLHSLIYDRFVKPIDGNDNGIDPFVSTNGEGSIEVLYTDCITIASKVGSFNPQWNEENNKDPTYVTSQFFQALSYMRAEFTGYLDNFVAHRMPIYGETTKIVEANKKVFTETGEVRRIAVLEHYIPLKDSVPEVERRLGVRPEHGLQFIIQPRDSGEWCVMTIPVQRGSKKFRLGIRAEWRGLRDCVVDDVSIRFVHITGFMGVAATREDAIRMAKLSLEQPGE